MNDADEADYALIESMLFFDGGLSRLEQHLARLTASARALGFSYQQAAMTKLLDDAVAGLADATSAYKVRLVLERDGFSWAEAEPLRDSGRSDVMIAGQRVSSSDSLTRHKTTRRAIFDSYADRLGELGLYDVLFLNEKSELAEASRSNVFVEIDGQLLTPPVEAGLLPGVYRNWVLSTRAEAREERLLDTDVLAADAIYLCNSVRGWRQVTLLAGRP